jgi:ABC-type protease/lipase transport system fused ATPase/permease subunit
MPKRTSGLMIMMAGTLVFSAVLLNLLTGKPASAHGGKTHAEAFTAFQALEKGAELYDRLVVSGKLDETWETQLKAVHINIRTGAAGQRETVVQFERTAGAPRSVFFFFDQSGAYSGSNFTGN